MKMKILLTKMNKSTFASITLLASVVVGLFFYFKTTLLVLLYLFVGISVLVFIIWNLFFINLIFAKIFNEKCWLDYIDQKRRFLTHPPKAREPFSWE